MNIIQLQLNFDNRHGNNKFEISTFYLSRNGLFSPRKGLNGAVIKCSPYYRTIFLVIDLARSDCFIKTFSVSAFDLLKHLILIGHLKSRDLFKNSLGSFFISLLADMIILESHSDILSTFLSILSTKFYFHFSDIH